MAFYYWPMFECVRFFLLRPYNIYDGSAQIFAHFGTLHQIVHSYNIVFLESAHCTEARKCQNGQVFFETAFDGFFLKKHSE